MDLEIDFLADVFAKESVCLFSRAFFVSEEEIKALFRSWMREVEGDYIRKLSDLLIILKGLRVSNGIFLIPFGPFCLDGATLFFLKLKRN